jgi:hypothetical protein
MNVVAAASVPSSAPEASPPSTPPAAGVGMRLSLSRVATLFALATLLVVWLAVALLLLDKRSDTLTAQLLHNGNLARALQEQTLRVFASTDQATLRLRDAVVSGSDPAPDLVRYANETGLAPKILVQLSLVGPDGRFIGSNLDPQGIKTGPVDLTEREHVRIHLNPAYVEEARRLPAGGLFIGRPVLGKVSKRWTIQVSRRISAADGRALGVVVASLDPGYFEEVFKQVDLGQQGGLTLGRHRPRHPRPCDRRPRQRHGRGHRQLQPAGTRRSGHGPGGFLHQFQRGGWRRAAGGLPQGVRLPDLHLRDDGRG